MDNSFEAPQEEAKEEAKQEVDEASEEAKRVDSATFDPEAVLEAEMVIEEAEAVEAAIVEAIPDQTEGVSETPVPQHEPTDSSGEVSATAITLPDAPSEGSGEKVSATPLPDTAREAAGDVSSASSDVPSSIESPETGVPPEDPPEPGDATRDQGTYNSHQQTVMDSIKGQPETVKGAVDGLSTANEALKAAQEVLGELIAEDSAQGEGERQAAAEDARKSMEQHDQKPLKSTEDVKQADEGYFGPEVKEVWDSLDDAFEAIDSGRSEGVSSSQGERSEAGAADTFAGEGGGDNEELIQPLEDLSIVTGLEPNQSDSHDREVGAVSSEISISQPGAIQGRWGEFISDMNTGDVPMDINLLVQEVIREEYEDNKDNLPFYRDDATGVDRSGIEGTVEDEIINFASTLLEKIGSLPLDEQGRVLAWFKENGFDLSIGTDKAASESEEVADPIGSIDDLVSETSAHSPDGIIGLAGLEDAAAQQELSDTTESDQDVDRMKSAVREEIASLQDELDDWPKGETRTITYTTWEKQTDGSYKRVEKTEEMTKEQAEDLIQDMEAFLEGSSSVRGIDADDAGSESAGLNSFLRQGSIRIESAASMVFELPPEPEDGLEMAQTAEVVLERADRLMGDPATRAQVLESINEYREKLQEQIDELSAKLENYMETLQVIKDDLERLEQALEEMEGYPEPSSPEFITYHIPIKQSDGSYSLGTLIVNQNVTSLQPVIQSLQQYIAQITSEIMELEEEINELSSEISDPEDISQQVAGMSSEEQDSGLKKT